MKRIIPLILTGVFLLTACGSKTGIEVRNAWARPASQGGNGGAYFELQNHDSTPDELTGASSDIAEVVEIHESKIEGDVMQMHMLPSLPIEANATVTFKPGGLHVMFINLKRDLKSNDGFDIVLHFKNHEDIIVHVTVGDAAPEAGHDM